MTDDLTGYRQDHSGEETARQRGFARPARRVSLDSMPAASCDYHEYQVIKTFTVDAGPIAPWFGQPGHGLQFQLDPTLIPGAPSTINVGWLVSNGYMERLN